MGAIILACIIGMWLAAILSYLMVIRPLIEENGELKELIHQQTKIGFFEETKKDGHE